MANYVDEKIAKITLDNKTFNENARQTLSVIDRLKSAFNNLDKGSSTKGIQKSMDDLTSSVEKSTTKTTGILAKLKSVFKKSNEEFDMSGAAKSVDKMNTDIANKTARTSDILSRLKGIFQKADSGIDFQNTTASIDKLNAKVNSFDASGLSEAFETALYSAQRSLTAMDIAVGNIMANMIQKSMGFANQFTSGWRDGLSEYTNKMNSIQTIKSNTESAFGGDVNRQMVQINRTLADLNEYADQTIYSFEDMTRNIGTFTAAGVGLEDSAIAIKGIANLAAASGSSSMQASTAMYQLSQALASGKVSLMDWNSVVNAGMGGEVFKNALMGTAEAMGINVDRTKTFRDTLQDGWLTSEVLLETLKKFSTNESMIDAATKVKTFGQLIDTTKEAIGSGWAETWEYVFGGLEEAKGLWSGVAKEIGAFLDDNQGKFFDTVLQMERNLGNFRNAMFKTWKDGGGQTAFFEGITNSVKILMTSLTSLRQGFRSVMGDYKEQANVLIKITTGFRDFTAALLRNKQLQETLTSVGAATASILKTIGSILSIVFGNFNSANGNMQMFLKTIERFANGINNLFANIRSNENVMTGFANIGKTLGNVWRIVLNLFQLGATIVSQFLSAFKLGDGSGFKSFSESLLGFSEAVLNFTQRILKASNNIGIFKAFGEAVSALGTFIANSFTNLRKALSFEGISSTFGAAITGFINLVVGKFEAFLKKVEPTIKKIEKALNVGDIVTAIIGFLAIKELLNKEVDGGFFETIFKDLFGGIKDFIDNGTSLVKNAGEAIETFGASVKAFTTLINALTLATIAISLMMLVHSIKELSKLEMEDISKGIIGVGAAALTLVKAFKSLSVLSTGLPKGSVTSMVGFAIAIRILASAMKSLSEIDTHKLDESMLGLLSVTTSLVAAMKLMSGMPPVGASAFKMIGFAISMKILVSALRDIAEIPLYKLTSSIISLSSLMLALSGTIRIISGVKVTLRSIFSMISFAISMKILVSALNDIAKLSPDRLGGSLVSLVTIMTTLAGVVKIINGVKIKMSAMFGIIVFVGTVKVLADILSKIADLDPKRSGDALLSLETIILTLAGVSKILNSVKINLGTVALIVSFGYSLYEMSKSLMLISVIKPDRLIPALVSMGAVLAMVVLSAKALNSSKSNLLDSLANAGLVTSFASLLKQIGDTLYQLSSLNTDAMYNSVMAMGMVLGALVLTAKGISSVKTDGFIEMLALSALVYSIGVSLSKVAEFSWQSILAATVSIGATLGILVLATKGLDMMSNAAPIKLLALSAALMGLAIPIRILSGLSWASLTVGLLALAGNLTILLAAAAMAQFLAPGLAALSAALLSFGVSSLLASMSIAAAGAGFLMIAMGLEMLVKRAPKLVEALIALIDGFIKVVNTRGPQFVAALIKMMTLSLRGLAIMIPEFVKFGIDLLSGLLEGLAQSAPRLASAAVDVVVNFSKSLMDNIHILIQTAIEMAIKIVEVLGETLISVKDRLIPALTNLFSVILDVILSVLDGLIGPILSKIVEIFTPVAEFIVTLLSGLAAAIEPVLTPIANVLMSLFQTVASVITDIANVVIALIQGIETVVNGFVTIITSILTTIQSAFESFSSVVGSIAGVITAAINGVVAIVQQIAVIISATFNGIAQTIMTAGMAIQSVLQGIGSIFQSVGSAIQSVLQGVGSVIQSFGTSVKSILEGVGSAFESVGTGIKTAMEGVGTVIEKIGGSIRTVLDGIAGIFDSIGTAALNAGKGFDKIADGVSQILQYSLGELVSNLGAVADAIIKISAQSAGMETAGTGLRSIGSALTTFSTEGMTAVTVLQSLASTLPIISAAMLTLPGPTQQVATSMQQLAVGIMGMAAPLQMVSMSITGFSTGMTMLGTAMVAVVPSITMFQTTLNMIPAGLSMVSSAITSAGSVATTLGSQFTATASMSASAFMSISSTAVSTFGMLASTISSGMATATNAIRGGMQQMTAAITQSMNQSRSIVQSSMTQMTSTIRSQGQQMVSIARTMGQQVGQNITNGIRSATGPVSSAMAGLVNAVRGQAGNGQAGGHYVGSMIGQGVAQGMWSAVGSVQAAANAIINAANAAARAKAQIHSPSRLFAKTVGRYIPEGVAMGIDKFAHTAIDSTVAVIDGMANGAGRAVTTMGENLSNLTTGAMGIVTDVINNALESDLDFSPTISPVVDLDNLKKLDTIASNAEIKMGAIPSLSLPSTDRYHRIDPSSYGNTTTNTSETNVSITVEMDGTPNPKEFAQQVSREMKRALDAQRMSKGDPVY